MDNPTRLMVSGVSIAFFMVGAVMFGEGNKQKKEEVLKHPAAVQAEKAVDDKPAPEQVKPVAPPPPPAQAPDTSANELRP